MREASKNNRAGRGSAPSFARRARPPRPSPLEIPDLRSQWQERGGAAGQLFHVRVGGGGVKGEGMGGVWGGDFLCTRNHQGRVGSRFMRSSDSVPFLNGGVRAARWPPFSAASWSTETRSGSLRVTERCVTSFSCCHRSVITCGSLSFYGFFSLVCCRFRVNDFQVKIQCLRCCTRFR